MKDAKEQKLIEARDVADHKMDEALCKWAEVYRKLWKYQESKAQRGGKVGE